MKAILTIVAVATLAVASFACKQCYSPRLGAADNSILKMTAMQRNMNAGCGMCCGGGCCGDDKMTKTGHEGHGK